MADDDAIDAYRDYILRRRAAQVERDFRLHGFAAFNAMTGERVDPREITHMDEGDPFEGMGFNPSEFFAAIRRSASVKAGAIIFGQAQVAYYDTLKQGGMDDEAAYALTAHTTEALIRGLASAIGPVSDVLLKAAAMSEYFDMLKPKDSGKEVPGEQ